MGAELGFGKASSLQLMYGWNPWKFGDNKKMRHWSLMPEYRYWFCSPLNGHFIGVHALGGQYNVSGIKIPLIFDDADRFRYQGWYAGGGFTYGYSHILGKHWNVEAAIGVGYIYFDYKKYECQVCGAEVDRGHKNYIGLTKAAINFVYVF
ncbi:MAG: DUF3575 domain-containing protein [Paraprevotella sp.]|nr:DUF3575 domain-containing protein [Paraprevotella sp.]